MKVSNELLLVNLLLVIGLKYYIHMRLPSKKC